MTRRTKKSNRHHTRIARAINAMESLESRTLRSGGSVDYHDLAYLTIQGTSASDNIEVDVTDWENPQVRDWHVEFNGESYSFPTPLITNLTINGLGGNDHISLNGLPTGVYTHVTTGSGNDTFDITEMDTGEMWINANGGTDTLNFHGADFDNNVYYPETDYALTSNQIQFSSGQPRVNFSGMQNINLTGSSGDDTIKVLSVGTGQNVVVDGQQGDDKIIVGDNHIAANIKGKLTIDGGSHYAAWGGDGDDTVTFLNGLSGGELDTLTYSYFSTNGLASPIGYSYVDHMSIVSSLSQNDIVNISSTNSRLKSLSVNTAGGNDVINLGNNVVGVSGLAATDITLNGGSGNDMVSADDRVRATTAGYIINATAFKATSTKKVTLSYLERFDLWGGSGNNTYNCFAAVIPVNIHAGKGNDTIMTGSGNDSVWGGAGYDNIWTNGGNDWIDGGTESDYISGGAGTDTISYATRMNSVYVDLNNPAGVNGQTGEFDFLVGDFENVEGGYGNDNIKLRTSAAGSAWGGGGGDTLIGGNGNDHLYGGAGLDLLKGMGGSDTLDGGERSDSLAGGAGNDVLIMTDGEKDYYDGGTGTNTFSKDLIDVFKAIA